MGPTGATGATGASGICAENIAPTIESLPGVPTTTMIGCLFDMTITVGGGAHSGSGETLSYAVVGIGATIVQSTTDSKKFTINPQVSGSNTMLAIVSDGCQIATRQFSFSVFADTIPVGYVGVCPGTFEMGSPTGELGRDSDETQHSVTISRAFLMKATEVTQGEWQAQMGNNPSQFSTCGTTCPVEQVSWWDAVAYCNAMSAAEGLTSCYDLTGCSTGEANKPGTGNYTCTGVTFVGLTCTGYRLPTESEWEYSARAGTTTAFFNGEITQTGCTPLDANLNAIGWYCGNADAPHVVKGKQANAWGLYDMSGNVWEWVWDRWGTYPGTVTDPLGAAIGSVRVNRGSAWFRFASDARAAARDYYGPNSRNGTVGFRLGRSL